MLFYLGVFVVGCNFCFAWLLFGFWVLMLGEFLMFAFVCCCICFVGGLLGFSFVFVFLVSLHHQMEIFHP